MVGITTDGREVSLSILVPARGDYIITIPASGGWRVDRFKGQFEKWAGHIGLFPSLRDAKQAVRDDADDRQTYPDVWEEYELGYIPVTVNWNIGT